MRKIFISLMFLLVLIGCGDNDNVVESNNNRNLIIISDDKKGSDFALTVLGGYKSSFDDLQIDFIQSEQFDVYGAGYLLEVAAMDYPDGSYFISTVEPGAGTKRICFAVGNRRFIVPDNGLATKVFKRYNVTEIYFVDNPAVIGGNEWDAIPIADFYKFAGISLLKDIPLSQMGTKCTEPVKLSIQDPEIIGDTLKCEVLFKDNFGNCYTNVTADFKDLFTNGDVIRINTGTKTFFAKCGTTYSSVNVGENVCFFNSNKRLEIAIDYGDLASKYSLSAGSKLSIVKVVPRIGILRYNSSDISQNIVDGFKKQLASLGLTEGKIKYIEVNANGDSSKLPLLTTQLVAQGVDMIVPVSTPASQAAVNYVADSIPVVYTYVTSPEFAGIVGVRSNVTGLSDAQNVKDYLDFVKALFPQLTKAGRIYNNTEANSQFTEEEFQKYSLFYNLSLVTETVQNTDGITSAYNNLINKGITTILTTSDNTLHLGIGNLANIGLNDNKYIIGEAKEDVDAGVLASISVDYETFALETGNYIYSVLLGCNPDDKPIKRFSSEYVALNKNTAAKLGYTFSDSLLKTAKYILE